jgi:adenylate cyclase
MDEQHRNENKNRREICSKNYSSNYNERIILLLEDSVLNTPRLEYHNVLHSLDVWNAVMFYSAHENIQRNSRFLLESAAIIHDKILIPGRNDNETRTAIYARNRLPELNYSPAETDAVAKLIEATDLKKFPKSHLEQIMRDADVDNLGRKDFLEKNEALYHEIKNSLNPNMTRHDWYQGTLNFLKSHEFYTRTAQKYRNVQKETNIVIIEKLIEKTKKRGIFNETS